MVTAEWIMFREKLFVGVEEHFKYYVMLIVSRGHNKNHMASVMYETATAAVPGCHVFSKFSNVLMAW